MSTTTSLAGLETFDALNIEYENAYKNNPFKKECVSYAISLLKPGVRVLDVGCGTGVPVSAMLSGAGLDVVGFDISPKMVQHAQTSVPNGSFSVSDMLNYDVEARGEFDGVFMIFAHLQFSYADFHFAAYRFARALAPSGLFVIGQMPLDSYVAPDDPALDEEKVYVEDYPAPFMGEMLPTFMVSAEGQREILRSMGLEIVWEGGGSFLPTDKRCVPEEQQYIVARRVGQTEIQKPWPLPKVRNSK